jgi:hypothetical protein
MRFWVFAAIPLALIGLIAGEYVSAPAPNSTRALLAAMRKELRFTYHDCVPLGWKAVPVSGTYSPGYTASVQNDGLWLDALWRGHIERSDLRSAQARDVFALLNRLAREGLLTRSVGRNGWNYYMTTRALPYYYGSSVFHDNRDSLPYLCYSTIVPQHIDWLLPAASHAGSAPGGRWYKMQFSWTASRPPGWAGDVLVREHSVVLPPLTSPTTASVVYDGAWYVDNIYDRGWMLPALKSGLR